MSRVEILIADDPDHEEIFAEIYVDDKFVALVSQDNGMENLLIEFPGINRDETMIARKVEISLFLEGLSAAQRRLAELPKADQ